MVLGEQIPDPGIRGGMERLVGADAIGPHANDHASWTSGLFAMPSRIAMIRIRKAFSMFIRAQTNCGYIHRLHQVVWAKHMASSPSFQILTAAERCLFLLG